MPSKNNIISINIIIFSIILVWIIITWYLYEKQIEHYDKKDSDIITLVKNTTWNTSLEEDIPYVSWDNLEYSIILKPNDSKITKVDISNIENKINIKDIKIDWEDISIDDLNNIDIKEDTVIEISWEAKDDKKIESDNEIIITKEDIDQEVESNEDIDNQIINEEASNNKISNVLLNKTNFSSNINNLLEITWDNLEEIKFVTIWSNSFTPKLIDSKLYIWIDSDIFWTWNYFVIFQLNNWDIVTHDEQISFTYSDSKVNVANITPNVFKNDIDRNIVLQWVGFSKVISIQLSNNVILKNTNFNIINDNVMSLLIPKELNPWKYKLNIMDTEWIYRSDFEIEITN